MTHENFVRVCEEVNSNGDDSSRIWRRIKSRKRSDIRSEAKVADLTAFEAEGIRLTGLESVDRGTCHDRENTGGWTRDNGRELIRKEVPE